MSEHENEPDEAEEPEQTTAPEPDENEVAEEAEETPEPEAEPEQPEARGPSEAELRKREQAGQRAIQAYARKLSEVYAEEANELLPCPLCGDTPWPGFVHLRAAGKVPPEVVISTQTFLGLAQPAEYQPSNDVSRCDGCAGRGQQDTGSLVPGKERITCGKCKGFGYYPPPATAENGHHEQHVFTQADLPAGAPVEHADRDNWGEPRILPDGRENPNFGKQPQFKIPVEPYGITANLTAQWEETAV